ncbi:type 1 glutamine amidotransferase domain-containing protein [Bradyrhizobium sp. 177]|uniref:type 1 glutamine amidotransferase domain-containing protein n=1 Tax=Bradyrhizobium sp. 177 TaxID=2782647 RepID=UPI001FF967EB|nr:type 1 glutamine amidotransferase domain-containing protein [Bradyrhizobium sp. 177]
MRKILIMLSEWGFWGEELIGPLEVFDSKAYLSAFCTPTGKRPRALPPSMDPSYIDPPLGKSVTSPEMAAKVRAIDDASCTRLKTPISLAALFPERPYWSGLTDDGKEPEEEIGSISVLRRWEDYYRKRDRAQKEMANVYDAVLLVGGSGPMIDMVNNYRVHDLILGFLECGKPIAAECYGVACLAQARHYDLRKSIIWGKHVTGHAIEYDYRNNTGVLSRGTGDVLHDRGDNFVNFGPPFYTLEYILRDAVGPDGAFHGNVGKETSVIVDYPFITGRSTPDSYMTGEKLVETLESGLKRFGW